MDSMFDDSVLSVRPHQLLCLICSLGEEDGAPCGPALSELLERIRRDPGLPLALRCHSDDSFAYQSPGRDADTPEADFNQKRDMEILCRTDLAPGSVLPARIAFGRVHKAISLVQGICGFDSVTSPAWKGCRFAGTGRYERGHTKGLEALFPPRDAEEMRREKAASMEAMLAADAIRVRPHILVCAIAQWGAGIRPPYKEDNLPELVQHVLQHPETPITLVAGADHMVCAPCPHRCASRGVCLIAPASSIGSGGLFNEMKDLNVLQATGLTFGATLPANEIFRLLFTRIPKTAGVCGLDHEVPELSVWWDPCPCPDYEKGRAELMKEMGCEEQFTKSRETEYP